MDNLLGRLDLNDALVALSLPPSSLILVESAGNYSSRLLWR